MRTISLAVLFRSEPGLERVSAECPGSTGPWDGRAAQGWNPSPARVNAGPLQSSRSRQPKDLQKLWCPIEFNAVPGCVTLGKALLTVMSPKGW